MHAALSLPVVAWFDDGRGPELYAGGQFLYAGGMAYIAKWDGSGWSALGHGVTAAVYALEVGDVGGGPALYAGGAFKVADGVVANRIAKWNGLFWSAVGSGVDEPVRALSAFDDGSGPALYAGGEFHSAGVVAASGLARWDGASWSPLGSSLGASGGIGPNVSGLAVLDDGGGEALYASGRFEAFDSGDAFLAKWGCPTIEAVPGCWGNQAVLVALSSSATIGQPLSLLLHSSASSPGIAFLGAGLDGTVAGCGVFVPGFGELLLALAPFPVVAAQAPIVSGGADFAVDVPADPAFVGAQVLLQALNFGLAPGAQLELSTGLAVTFTG